MALDQTKPLSLGLNSLIGSGGLLLWRLQMLMRSEQRKRMKLYEGRILPGRVAAVSLSAIHQFSKPVQKSIRLLAGLGVEGDTHLGVTVQHRSRVAKDPTRPNLRQVHLIHEELLDELCAGGFQVAPGMIRENITTRGIDLLALPRGARLHIVMPPS